MNNSNSDNEQESVEDRAFDLTVRKMRSKIYPQQLPKHVSEMSKFTDYGDNKFQPYNSDKWPFKI